MYVRSVFVRRLGIGLLIVAALTLSGCIGPQVTAEEIVSQSFETGASPHIVVETFNGHLDVSAGSGGLVQVEVTKRGAGFTRADAEADLDNVEVSLTQEGQTIRVIARRTGGLFAVGNSGASIELSVPAGSSLDLHSSNGRISSLHVAGDVRIDTSNGDVEVRGGSGRLDLQTSNGSVDIEATGAAVEARTSNGSIDFDGWLADGSHSLHTSNGRITITLPRDAQFRIDASTSNGSVWSDFAVAQSGPSRDNELRGSVGENPAVSITATSSNGRISIRKGS
jgi:hypothetical protein